MESDPDLECLRQAIAGAFPELARAEHRLLSPGWDSVAVEVDGCFVFKFPRSEIAARSLEREARLLPVIRPAVTLPVPDLSLHPGPPLFSRHRKLAGEHLTASVYESLPEAARQRLAEHLAQFFAELHGLDPAAMRAAGATPIEPWLPPHRILDGALPALPAELRPFAERTVAAYAELAPDPEGTTYGFFDGHGWNMAFDRTAGRLNGVYDFADSGFGPLHQEFVYPSFVSPELTARILPRYEAITGRRLDRRRVAILTGAHRLFELAELAHDPAQVSEMVRHVADWACGPGLAQGD